VQAPDVRSALAKQKKPLWCLKLCHAGIFLWDTRTVREKTFLSLEEFLTPREAMNIARTFWSILTIAFPVRQLEMWQRRFRN
jgi:hypothetical protein